MAQQSHFANVAKYIFCDTAFLYDVTAPNVAFGSIATDLVHRKSPDDRNASKAGPSTLLLQSSADR
jgi:hypothetical protein